MNNILSNFEKPIVPPTPQSIGIPKITFPNIEHEIDEFFEIYRTMPNIDNRYGMQSPHLFLLWHSLKQLQPEYVIESGVYKGLGTWWIEQACPDAKVISIDIDLTNIEYKSDRVTYYCEDFSLHKWDEINKEKSLIFFDDHQNALMRLMQMKWMGFYQAIFDDNYAPYTGDCYSCKKIFASTGNQVVSDHINPNNVDSYFLYENIDSYQELPAPFKLEKTRFGYNWVEPSFLNAPANESQSLLFKEADSFTYMCYVELKHNGG